MTDQAKSRPRPLSDEARKARNPPPPEYFVDALQDRIPIAAGKTRAAKSYKVTRK